MYDGQLGTLKSEESTEEIINIPQIFEVIEVPYDGEIPSNATIVTLEEIMGGTSEELTDDPDFIQCNIDVLYERANNDILVAGTKRNKPKFRKMYSMFSLPLEKDGSGLPDWSASDDEGHLWTEEELINERKRITDIYVPLLLRERKGRHLLRKHVNDTQWLQFLNTGYFFVKKYGKLFKLGGYYGIQVLDEQGRETCSYCIHGKDLGLPQSDILIMQKLMLETDFELFERIANKRTIIQREELVPLLSPEIIEYIDSIDANEEGNQYEEVYDLVQNLNLQNVLEKKLNNGDRLTNEQLSRAFTVAIEEHRAEQKRKKNNNEEWEEAFAKNGITEKYEKDDLRATLAAGLFVAYKRGHRINRGINTFTEEEKSAAIDKIMDEVFPVALTEGEMQSVATIIAKEAIDVAKSYVGELSDSPIQKIVTS